MRSFHDLATSTAAGTAAVMAGIAEALVATGIGLIVALPAVAAYNAFTRHVERATSASEVLGHEILAPGGGGDFVQYIDARDLGQFIVHCVERNIVVVLLIIFMLTANLIAKQAIEVELPRASQSTSVNPTTLAVTLTREGALYLNGRPTDQAGLREAVRAAVAKDPKTQAIISGDRGVSHGRVVWVLDVVKSLGVASFAIQIDPTSLIPPGGP